jgi:hypothetical protein
MLEKPIVQALNLRLRGGNITGITHTSSLKSAKSFGNEETRAAGLSIVKTGCPFRREQT